MLVSKQVYVVNKHGKPLMPTTPPKARILLKEGKAKVIRRTPFTIQLLYGSSGYKQPITLGVDSGYEHVGLSAVTKKQEIFAAEVQLRKDVSKLLSERRQYRRTRRSRKTRYRKPRFLNRVRTKHKGWLTPSIQHKLDSHLRIIQRVTGILPITKIIVETANFDIQRVKNPNIKGKQYQEGEQLGFNNVKAYVLHRDGYVCQHCKGHTKEPRLNVHHVVRRSDGGSDRPDNLVTLCKTCHDRHHAGSIQLKVKIVRGYRAETFMSTIRKRLILRLQELYNNVEETFGYVTKTVREQLGLVKSHINDAFCIAQGNLTHVRSGVQYLIKQVRKQNRKLFKGKRSEIRNTAPRFINGFQRYDKIKFMGNECFVWGRRSRGYFNLRKLDGTPMKVEPNYKKLKLLESFQTLLFESKSCGLLSYLTEGGPDIDKVWYGLAYVLGK